MRRGGGGGGVAPSKGKELAIENLAGCGEGGTMPARGGAAAAAAAHGSRRFIDGSTGACVRQGLTFVHFPAQPQPFGH
jgi:hypothetical protein